MRVGGKGGGGGGGEGMLQEAGQSREYLTADHNWIPLPLADGLAHLAMELTHETDEERWGQRFGNYLMEWKPSHDERSYIGSYTMGLGSPRAIFSRAPALYRQIVRYATFNLEEMHRAPAVSRLTPPPACYIPHCAP